MSLGETFADVVARIERPPSLALVRWPAFPLLCLLQDRRAGGLDEAAFEHRDISAVAADV